MPYLRFTLIYVLLMTLVVVASNILVQYPLSGSLFGVNLGDLLTWGAFTYPIAFLVTDLTNRQFGPSIARRVVLAGFVVGVTLSFWTSIPRIAVASGTAYLIGQLLDISVFNRLRRQRWWHAPLAGSMLGSVLDTALFFSIAFAASFSFVGPNDAFVIENAPILGVFTMEAPRWISWALGDLSVKVLVGLVMLLPYGALMNTLKPMPGAVKTGRVRDRASVGQITLANQPSALQSAVRGTARRRVDMQIKDVIDIVEAASATLSGSTFNDVNLSGTVFENVNLSGASFNNINLSGASFTDNNMSGWSIDDVNFSGLKLSNSNLSGAQITSCRMTGMKIDGIAVEDLMAAYKAAQQQQA